MQATRQFSPEKISKFREMAGASPWAPHTPLKYPKLAKLYNNTVVTKLRMGRNPGAKIPGKRTEAWQELKTRAAFTPSHARYYLVGTKIPGNVYFSKCEVKFDACRNCG